MKPDAKYNKEDVKWMIEELDRNTKMMQGKVLKLLWDADALHEKTRKYLDEINSVKEYNV